MANQISTRPIKLPDWVADIETQRPEVRGQMRQLVGIFQGLTRNEQTFIINKLLTSKKAE